MNLLKINKIGVFAIMLFMALNVYADHEQFFNSIRGAHFAADSSVTVADDKYMTSFWSTIQKNLSCTDIVTLKLNEDTSLFLTAPHTCRVDLEVYYYLASGAEDSLTKSLTIAYDSAKGKSFNFQSSFKFSGGYKVKSKILAVYYDGTISTSFPKIFELDESILINRVYDYSCSAPSSISSSADYDNQKLNMTWGVSAGADEYDLEWTFYDDSSSVVKEYLTYPYSTFAFSNFNFLYKNNATRVTVEGNSYTISLVYNPGYIFYRVRAVHYDTLGNRIEEPWSSDVADTLLHYSSNNGYHWSGHENTMNWQYTAAYAEQGKRKEVASYFDGSLRNRQSVTLNNTENKAIIGETMYDYQGRAAVTTLPAPIDSEKIVYYNKYNLDPLDSEFNRKDFDTGGCGAYPTPMDSVDNLDSVRGSSGYYSSSNRDKTSGFNAFLPDAQGYPYTQTEYTPDNTGRIARQSLPGKTHYLGSGHETKYYYGKPAQVELDRLFGNEVGNNSHYLKNMVVDANGQISVSYVDANGKTIATALAGNPPSNTSPIASYYPETTLDINLLDTNGYHPTNTSILSSYGLLATNSGDYHFAYKLFPTHYSTGCESSYCTDCIYDINLLITPACGGSPPIIIHHDTNFTYKEVFDTTCSRDSNIIDTFTVYLESGDYNVSRLITVDPGAINYYTQRFLSQNTCLANYQSFLDSAIASTNFSGCNMTCQTCLTELGTDTAFIRKYITQLINAGDTVHHQDTLIARSLYDTAVNNCNLLCAPSNICSGLYQEMLADVSPGGQYCLYDTSHGVYTAKDNSSVLESDYQTPGSPYLDENGNPDSVLVNSVKELPQNLTVTQFILNWQPSWAASLVTFHPEYCYYDYCNMDTASNRYDIAMENTTTYTAALAAGFINPLGDGTEPSSGSPYTINWQDPYFASGGLGNIMRTYMISHIDNYINVTISGTPEVLSLWQTAALAVNCEADTLQGLNTTYDPTTSFGSGCSGTLNMEWAFFRGVYFGMKQHIQDSLENYYVEHTSGCSGYAYCIGQSSCSSPYNSKVPRHITPAEVEPSNHLLTTHWSSASAAAHAVDSAMNAACDTICKSYAFSWIADLNGCGTLTTAQSDSLIAGMVEVCELGCNASHPFGSSNTPGYAVDSRGDRDFEDVILRVLGDTVLRSNVKCDSLDINAPSPYIDSTGIAGAPVTYYRPSACICNKLDTLLSHYYLPDSLSGDTTYKNFADFLNKKFGGSLADSTVYSLIALCNNSSCFFMQNPVQLPIWMTCCSDTSYVHRFIAYNSSHVQTWDTNVSLTQGCCIKCNDIDAAMRIFQETSPPGTDTLVNYQTLLTNFLNGTFGFNLTYSQYMNFYNTCEGIHCCWSVAWWASSERIYSLTGAYDGQTVDSTCGGVSITDSLGVVPIGGDTIYKVFYRKVTGAKADSIAPTLCNEPLNTPPSVTDTNNCMAQLMQDASYNAQNAYTKYIDSVTSAFTAGYITHCMQIDDSFHVNAPFDEYHYTLYYYDQAGNLVKTIPPQGVHPITSVASLDSITNYRAGLEPKPVYPDYDSLSSLYWFNTLNSPLQQANHDGNITRYWYDRLGRLVLSQDALQAPYFFSYTIYDALNRIIEVGQLNTYIKKKTITVWPSLSVDSGYVSPLNYNYLTKLARNDSSLNFWVSHTAHTQVTHTYYDSVAFSNIPLEQENLRKRISTITYQERAYDTLQWDTIRISYLHHGDTVENYYLWQVPADTVK